MSPRRGRAVSWWVCAGIWANALITAHTHDAHPAATIAIAAVLGLCVGMARLGEDA